MKSATTNKAFGMTGDQGGVFAVPSSASQAKEQIGQNVAHLIVRDESGKPVQRWLLDQAKCTLGSSDRCTLHCNLPGIEALNALIVFGVQQAFVRALVPNLSHNGVQVNELLLDDQRNHFELAGHRFELVRESVKPLESMKANYKNQRMRFAIARPFDLSTNAPPTRYARPSEREPAPPLADAPWLKSLIERTIEPLEAQIESLLVPMAEYHSRIVESEKEQKANSASDQQRQDELANEITSIVSRQSATMEALSERLKDVNQQLAAIEKIIAEDSELESKTKDGISNEVNVQRLAIEQLQTGMVAVTESLNQLHDRQHTDQQAQQQWKQDVQSQLEELSQILSDIKERTNHRTDSEILDAVQMLQRSQQLAQEEVQSWQYGLQDQFDQLEKKLTEITSTPRSASSSHSGAPASERVNQPRELSTNLSASPHGHSPDSDLKVSAEDGIWSISPHESPECDSLSRRDVEQESAESEDPVADLTEGLPHNAASEFSNSVQERLDAADRFLQQALQGQPETNEMSQESRTQDCDDWLDQWTTSIPSERISDSVDSDDLPLSLDVVEVTDFAEEVPKQTPSGSQDFSQKENSSSDFYQWADSGGSAQPEHIDAHTDASSPISDQEAVDQEPSSWSLQEPECSEPPTNEDEFYFGSTSIKPPAREVVVEQTDLDEQPAVGAGRSEDEKVNSSDDATFKMPNWWADEPTNQGNAVAEQFADASNQPQHFQSTVPEGPSDLLGDNTRNGVLEQTHSDVLQLETPGNPSELEESAFETESVEEAVEKATEEATDVDDSIARIFAEYDHSSQAGIAKRFKADHSQPTDSIEEERRKGDSLEADSLEESHLQKSSRVEDSFPESSLEVSNQEESDLEDSQEQCRQEECESGREDAEESSVEDYMRGLLARMRGEEYPLDPTSSNPSQLANLLPSLGKASSHTAKDLFATPVASGSISDLIDPDSYVSRSNAPEKANDMSALRDLANNSARTAIQKSTRQRYISNSLLKLSISVVGLTVAGVLFAINGFSLNIGLIATLASLMVAAIWGYDGIVGLRPLLKSSLVLMPPQGPDPDESNNPDEVSLEHS